MEEQDFEDRIARAEAAVRQISERVASISAELDDARSQLARVGTEASAAASSAAEASDRLDDLEDAQGLSSEQDASSETVEAGDKDEDLFAYKTIVGPDNYIYVLVPRDDMDGAATGSIRDALSGPFGNRAGSSSAPIGDKNESPWPLDGGGAPTEDRPDNSWAHFSWYKAGSSGSDVIVYAEVSAGKEITQGDEVVGHEGAHVSSISVCSFSSWTSKCSSTWPDSADHSTSIVPIAHVSNGLVIQMCFGSPCVSDAGTEGIEELDTERTTNPPGESVNRWQETPTNPNPNAPIQLRQFHDMTDTLTVQDASSTGSDPTAADVQILVRHESGTGTGTGRPRLEYVYGDGLYWLQGGTAQTNYGVSIKLGQNNSYITISAS